MSADKSDKDFEEKAEKVAKKFEKFAEFGEAAERRRAIEGPSPTQRLFSTAIATGSGYGFGWLVQRYILKGNAKVIPFGVGVGLGVALASQNRPPFGGNKPWNDWQKASQHSKSDMWKDRQKACEAKSSGAKDAEKKSEDLEKKSEGLEK